MSRSGRWRLAVSLGRVAAGCAVAGVVAWVGWKAAAALQEDVRAMPAAARAVAMRPPELYTDGVLTPDWLQLTLAVRSNAALMELDLERLHARLVAEPQVLTATLTRHFPDRLVVTLTERRPIARVMAELNGQREQLLVGRDGVLFAGEGHSRAVLDALPWLDGVRLVRQGDSFRPLEGAGVAADLISRAQLEAEHLFRSWRVVSLARLASDRELEVRTAEGATVVFSANDDYFRQLAKLDFLWERVVGLAAARPRIDLSLGREVPVGLDVEPLPVGSRPSRVTPAAGGNRPLLSLPVRSPSKSREL